jgi:hypothetical protein
MVYVRRPRSPLDTGAGFRIVSYTAQECAIRFAETSGDDMTGYMYQDDDLKAPLSQQLANAMAEYETKDRPPIAYFIVHKADNVEEEVTDIGDIPVKEIGHLRFVIVIVPSDEAK